MRLGIFGGTFDPIHVGHLMVAEEVRESLGLDQILFVPAGKPWLKADQVITDAHHRLKMVELAVAGVPRFAVSDVEVRRPGPSYTAHTLEELSRDGGRAADLYVIVGLDSLNEMHRWHDPAKVLDLSTVIGIPRQRSETLRRDKIKKIRPDALENIIVVETTRVDLSSSEIRRRVAEARSIRYRVQDGVREYIAQHGLYRD